MRAQLTRLTDTLAAALRRPLAAAWTRATSLPGGRVLVAIASVFAVISAVVGERRRRFAGWRRERPFWGASILSLAGLIIGIIPADLAMRFALVPNHFAFVGLIFSVLVVVSGIGAMWMPNFSTIFGITGALFSIMSLFGALGGFGIGMLLGALGGSLCIAWRPPEELDAIREQRSGVSRLGRLRQSLRASSEPQSPDDS